MKKSRQDFAAFLLTIVTVTWVILTWGLHISGIVPGGEKGISYKLIPLFLSIISTISVFFVKEKLVKWILLSFNILLLVLIFFIYHIGEIGML
ncbi:hypothetical protein [Listeria ivanovii]|uniref:Uncharacterized protein n=2 Tax=Listeria ivanovii TaxID=1638 RepID=A0ABS1G2L1_LISIV|nr:hypothetical protein [Listeria ivanovii]EFR97902.1 conserved hypothetical protein [Listeria ivanovii FSL F6-596]AIS59030.1 hypothetical protein JL58_03110 [Listeria ivanovii subsp. londoniensis]AIS61835.1 hypothetical protein JL53_03430 [Listeria ivanovii subsp. londoniensis]MBC2254687.1 hypothetical protein [Listeria ivanovii]MBK1961109.1 hypothetical protein [Listeria ivanovii subsp. londoniensis]